MPPVFTVNFAKFTFKIEFNYWTVLIRIYYYQYILMLLIFNIFCSLSLYYWWRCHEIDWEYTECVILRSSGQNTISLCHLFYSSIHNLEISFVFVCTYFRQRTCLVFFHLFLADINFFKFFPSSNRMSWTFRPFVPLPYSKHCNVKIMWEQKPKKNF